MEPAETNSLYIARGDHTTRDDIPGDIRTVVARHSGYDDDNVGFVISKNNNGSANDRKRHKVTYDRRIATGIRSSAAGNASVVPINEGSGTSIPLRANVKEDVYIKGLEQPATGTWLGAGSESVQVFFPPSQGARKDFEFDPGDPTTGWVAAYEDTSGVANHADKYLLIDGATTNEISWVNKAITQASFQMRRFIVTGINQTTGLPNIGGIQYLQSVTSGTAATWNATPSNTWLTRTDEDLTLPADWLGAAATVGHSHYLQVRPRNSDNVLVKWADAEWLLVQARNGETRFGVYGEDNADGTPSVEVGDPACGVFIDNNTAWVPAIDVSYMLPTHLQVRRASLPITPVVVGVGTWINDIASIMKSPRDDLSGLTFEYMANATGTAWSSSTSSRIAVTHTEGHIELAFGAAAQGSNRLYLYQARAVQVSGATSTHTPTWSAPFYVMTADV